jgi:membrane fusion protein (multidrug efflux system)
VLVPQQGVTRSATGEATALVIGPGNKVERRRLVLARAVGNQWLVSSGLKVGDRLIVEGLQRVRADQTVTPVAAGAKAPGRGASGAASGRGAGRASGPAAAPGSGVASAPGAAPATAAPPAPAAAPAPRAATVAATASAAR